MTETVESAAAEDKPFYPQVTDVYELLDAAEDRLSEQITRRFDELSAQLFGFHPVGGEPVPGALSTLLAQNQWLGENIIPATADLHRKFDAVIADVTGFITMMKTTRIPGLGKLGKKMKGGAIDAGTEEEDRTEEG